MRQQIWQECVADPRLIRQYPVGAGAASVIRTALSAYGWVVAKTSPKAGSGPVRLRRSLHGVGNRNQRSVAAAPADDRQADRGAVNCRAREANLGNAGQPTVRTQARNAI